MKKAVIGKDAVMKAVIEAATDLFSEKAPSRVSIREIASKAGVNHGLIHRHFGSKQNLIAAVVSNIDKQIRLETSSGNSFSDSFKLASKAAIRDPRVWRIPARLIMDGEGALLHQNQNSYLKDLRNAAAKKLDDNGFKGLTADESVIFLIALGFGLEMFGDYISESMEIEKPDGDELLRRIVEILP